MTDRNYGKYWICTPCALKQGARVTEGACTVVHGECFHCKMEATLTPWVDFDWPKDKQADTYAKMVRD